MKIKPPSEHSEQAAFVAWFRAKTSVRIFAIPNGSQRSRVTGARLKAEGVSPGVPDLYIPEWKTWIEMKRRTGGSVSKEQKDWIAYLRSLGDTVLICKGAEDAVRQIMNERIDL